MAWLSASFALSQEGRPACSSAAVSYLPLHPPCRPPSLASCCRPWQCWPLHYPWQCWPLHHPCPVPWHRHAPGPHDPVPWHRHDPCLLSAAAPPPLLHCCCHRPCGCTAAAQGNKGAAGKKKH
jgi:hypothetical protein